jgi:hypothetical protein
MVCGGSLSAMRATIDSAECIVIPRLLRKAALRAGADVEVT